jgi:hypothetical protein
MAMNKVSKFIAISCAATVAAFAVAGSASAQEWHRHHRGGGDAFAAGVAGLAVGVIAGAALASPPPRRYYDDDGYYAPPPPPRRVYYRPAYVYEQPVQVYRPALEPWSRSWFRYCSNRYRSFDPQSGTFVGYDGREHFCRG